jgi:Peptidase family M48
MADAGALQLTKDPAALCSALRKVTGHENLASGNAATMGMMISSRRGGIFATHPPLQERLDAIRAHTWVADTTTTNVTAASYIKTPPAPRPRRPAQPTIAVLPKA